MKDSYIVAKKWPELVVKWQTHTIVTFICIESICVKRTWSRTFLESYIAWYIFDISYFELRSIGIKILLFSETMIVTKKLKEFCQNTSVHGLAYVADDKSSWFKRLAWLAIFLVCFSYASITVKQSIDGEYTNLWLLLPV